MTVKLTERQIEDLAKPLVKLVREFYKDPENKRKFEEWLKSQEK